MFVLICARVYFQCVCAAKHLNFRMYYRTKYPIHYTDVKFWVLTMYFHSLLLTKMTNTWARPGQTLMTPNEGEIKMDS